MKKILIRYPFSCALAVLIWVVCLIPIPEVPMYDVRFIDKWTHFVMYGVLTITIWMEYRRQHKDNMQWSRVLVFGVLCPIMMGGCIEFAQAYLTTCRSGDVFDALCNSLGVLLGSGISWAGIILKHSS